MARRSNNSGGTPPSSAGATGKPVVTIRGPTTNNIPDTTISGVELMIRLARQWGYLLRVRSRWVGDPDLRATIGERAVGDLESIGVSRERIKQLAAADRIEVELHDDWPRNAIAARLIYEASSEFPWEYLLSAATRAQGRFRPLLISRLLRNGMSAVVPHPPGSVLFVESAPGRLKDKYEFDDEEERICAAVGATPDENDRYWSILKTPAVEELKETIREKKPEVIHVTGIDTHQAGWCLDGFYDDLEDKNSARYKKLVDPASGRLRDGMILWEDRVSELPVLYDELPDALIGAVRPRIVTLNLYYSGARIARELVKKGAHVALGFLDEIDDELAELFFQGFYWAWCRPDNDKEALRLSDAFLQAWKSMQDKPLYGTSIVIWMGRSVFEPPGVVQTRLRPRSGSRRSTKKAAK